ncbi:MAG: methyltransferase domain-containing protein [Pseudomonadota bacterium]
MSARCSVERHYSRNRLLQAIRNGLRESGLAAEALSVADLAPVDEFHVGGREATGTLLDQLAIAAGHRVLDVGCGLGGAARFAAHRYGCSVAGIDLTRDYVETGTTLCAWVGLGDRVQLRRGDATDIPHADAAFDRAYLMHVGMNVADKRTLSNELYRVLKPGGRLGIYDVMRVGRGSLRFPLPWATGAAGSEVATPAAYTTALQEAGFRITAENDRREFALEALARTRDSLLDTVQRPSLGLHILMGEWTMPRLENLSGNIESGIVAPRELIADKRIQSASLKTQDE